MSVCACMFVHLCVCVRMNLCASEHFTRECVCMHVCARVCVVTLSFLCSPRSERGVISTLSIGFFSADSMLPSCNQMLPSRLPPLAPHLDDL